MDADVLEILLKTIFGTRVRVVDCRVANNDLDYRVMIVRLSHPSMRVVIKVAGPMAKMACRFDRTAALYRRVAAETDIPMPEVIAYDAAGQDWPWRFLIYTYQPGRLWRAVRGRLGSHELAGAYRGIGEAVGQLHRLSFPAFGEIDGHGRVQSPAGSALEALRQHAARIIPAPHLLDTFLAVMETHAALFDGVCAAGLTHEDLHHSNLLFTRHNGDLRLAAILDFDKAWAGPVESDLARLELWRGMTAPAFWDGYCAFREVPPGYAERRPVYQLLWCLEYARSTREHLADTRQVCAALDCAPIESFELR